VGPSLLLHSHDFVGAHDVPAMSFFPGASVAGEAKVRLVDWCIDLLRRHFDVVPLARYVDRLDQLRTIEPRFFHGAAVRSEASGRASHRRTER
jgi:hypothetical protein